MIIDISSFNGKVEWEDVKGNVEGAIIRCGYGKNVKKQDDKQFVANIEGALEAGIKVGSYLTSYAIDEAGAKAEADHALRLIESYKDKLTLPVYINCSEEGTEESFAIVAKTFCDILSDNGYKAGIISRKSWFDNAKGLDDYEKVVEPNEVNVLGVKAETFEILPYEPTEAKEEIKLEQSTLDDLIEEIKKEEPIIEEPKKEQPTKKAKVEETFLTVITPRGLNVRDKAGKDGKIIKTLSLGTKVKKIGSDKDNKGNPWIQIELGETKGYCLGEFLE